MSGGSMMQAPILKGDGVQTTANPMMNSQFQNASAAAND